MPCLARFGTSLAEQQKSMRMRVAPTALLVGALAISVAHASNSTAHANKTNYPQRVVLIRHGEKNGGDDLSPRGYQRAKCLADHFAGYNISHLFAYADHPSRRSTETLLPLAEALNLPIDTRAGRDDTDKLIDHISDLNDTATAIVCWEHDALHDIAEALGVHGAPSIGSDEYDVQWSVRRGALVSGHENC